MANERVIEFFESLGQAAADVSAGDIDNRGYFTFVKDSTGKRLVLGERTEMGEALREFHPWPNEESWLRFLQAVEEDNNNAGS